MVNEKVSDITVEILKDIRDEIKGLREDTNERFEQMDKRFERMEGDIAQIRNDMSHIVSRFDNDLILMASDMENVKRRLQACEQRLGIQAQ